MEKVRLNKFDKKRKEILQKKNNRKRYPNRYTKRRNVGTTFQTNKSNILFKYRKKNFSIHSKVGPQKI